MRILMKYHSFFSKTRKGVSLDAGQDQRSVVPDLGPNCLQSVPADDKKLLQGGKELKQRSYVWASSFLEKQYPIYIFIKTKQQQESFSSEWRKLPQHTLLHLIAKVFSPVQDFYGTFRLDCT